MKFFTLCLKMFIGIIFLFYIFLMCLGCSINQGKSLLVVTGTNIGLKIGANELDKSPEIKIGYSRVEGAVVPVKEGTDGKLSTVSVLAKLNFKTMLGKDAGIQSLIATGKAAESKDVVDLCEEK